MKSCEKDAFKKAPRLNMSSCVKKVTCKEAGFVAFLKRVHSLTLLYSPLTSQFCLIIEKVKHWMNQPHKQFQMWVFCAPDDSISETEVSQNGSNYSPTYMKSTQ